MSIADELITHGWTQGVFEHRGAVCLRGAASLARGMDDGTYDCNSDQEDALYDALKIVDPLYFTPGSESLRGAVSRWQDADERTYDEVLRVAKLADEILGAS